MHKKNGMPVQGEKMNWRWNRNIELLLSAAFIMLAALAIRCVARQYETYAGQRFEIVMEGELGQWYVDTVEAVSKTERAGETELRLINGGRRIIRPPDYINELEE